MSYGKLASRDAILRQRARQPHRKGATIRARPETLAESVARHHGAGVGIITDSGKAYSPFDNLAEYERYAKEYDGKALGRIVRSLHEPEVRKRMSHDNGTAPELHVIGKFLHLGFVLGVEVFFQDIPVYGFRRMNRVFTADTGIWWGGRKVLMPVNGEFFHDRLASQREADERLTIRLQQLGTVLMIPARFCFQGDTLDSFFTQHLGVTV